MPSRPLTVNDSSPTPAAGRGPLWEAVAYFLRLGVVAFGGPAAHVAMMRRDLVEQRKWLSDQDLLDHLAVASLIPGPNSTELAMHIGARRAGWAGLWLGGVAFILPAFAIVLAFAWLYVEYGETPAGTDLLRGVQPVILAIVVQAIWSLRTTAVRAWDTAVVAFAAVVLAVLGLNEAFVIVGAGLALLAWRRLGPEPLRTPLGAPLPDPRTVWRAVRRWLRVTGRRAGGLVLLATPAGFALPELFWVFLKIGGTLYGSGYVLVAFLEADFVMSRGWLSEQTLVVAVAGTPVGVEPLLSAHVARLAPGDYFAVLAYVDRSETHRRVLKRLRHAVRDARGVATCVGFGPRFLHSTGQAFKGGAATGVFLQVTCDNAADLPIPGRGYTFGVVQAAQALGDLQVLAARGRRALRVHLGSDVTAGLERLTNMVQAALGSGRE